MALQCLPRSSLIKAHKQVHAESQLNGCCRQSWYGLPNRPLSGRVNFCPDRFSKDNATKDNIGGTVDLLVHELSHALFFGEGQFGGYIDEEFQPAPCAHCTLTYTVSSTRCVRFTCSLCLFTSTADGCPLLLAHCLSHELDMEL